MKKTNVRPLGENILIHPEKPEQKTSAGIYLPETASQERSSLGKVIAVGESDKIKVKAGQKVVFRRYGGEEVEIDGEEYLISSYKDVLAVIG
ncbi:MAG: co-chaperone GroES [Candidatus Moranbacteria bacterium CG_4_10_14_3_um_filter_45_9]|nr:MAG: co-chaperone GroES [Candidatus Moranbacteria bacterium CG2_30_45_14]PIX89893.1 MAG: co-chaperone GroES [Candidatus Moranbacteria bacterium CG_4_10_14_3_um_filter_45_9]PJA85758.1 MAG: co-chaperone GroES [Candidatus Moranbacteria bacterium CG_4_9_14_3_um_filter_45_14]